MMMYSFRILFARYVASTAERSVFACAWLWNLSKWTALRTRVLLYGSNEQTPSVICIFILPTKSLDNTLPIFCSSSDGGNKYCSIFL